MAADNSCDATRVIEWTFYGPLDRHFSWLVLSNLLVLCKTLEPIYTARRDSTRPSGGVNWLLIRSTNDASKLARSLFADNYTDVASVGKLSSAHSLVVHWLLAAFQSLRVCVPFGVSASTGSRLFLFADQLEVGVPSRDVWPDRPELDERQVTCDVGLWSGGGTRMFSDLLTSLCGDVGRRQLDVLLDPTPVRLAVLGLVSLLFAGGRRHC